MLDFLLRLSSGLIVGIIIAIQRIKKSPIATTVTREEEEEIVVVAGKQQLLLLLSAEKPLFRLMDEPLFQFSIWNLGFWLGSWFN